jgi:FKBP-type peptidyl-prolyl cis-trans isomerase 2
MKWVNPYQYQKELRKNIITFKIKKMKVENGNNVKVHYVGTLDNGEEFDNSYLRNETLNFTVGIGQMIKGFDNAVLGMEVGEIKNVKLSPDEAYGNIREDAYIPVGKENFPPDFEAIVGEMVQGSTQSGQPIQAVIHEVKENDIILNMNHPLAGEHLNFKIELVELNAN